MQVFLIITSVVSIGLNLYFMCSVLPRRYHEIQFLKNLAFIQDHRLNEMKRRVVDQVAKCNAVIRQFIDNDKKTNHANDRKKTG